MRKLSTIILLASLVICGCQNNEIDVPVSEQKTFNATIEESGFDGETKTSLDKSGNVLWKSGDQVSIFAGSTINEQYQVSDASDGQTSATLNKISDSGFTAGGEINNNVAYYPYGPGNSIAKSGTSYVVDAVLQSTQNYAADSFGNGAFPMAAVTTSTADMNLKFKNILGGLKLQLKGTASIASISVIGNNDEILCGPAEVMVSNSAVPVISLSDASAKTVTLDCGTGVQLNSETVTSFVIALPPMTMTSGFTVTATDTEGKQMEIASARSQTIKRSSILKMPVVEYVGVPVNSINGHEYVDLGLPSGIKWSNIDLGSDSPSANGLYFGWGETVGYAPSDHNFTIENNLEGIGYTGGTFSYESYGTKDDPLRDYIYNGTNYGKPLPAEYDAATSLWGNNWRMPTYEDFKELFKECTWEKIPGGYTVTSKVNGNYITFRNAGVCQYEGLVSSGVVGRYWSSTPGFHYSYSTDALAPRNTDAICLYTDNTGLYQHTHEFRYDGALIRPVSGPIQATVPFISSFSDSDPTSTTVKVSIYISYAGLANIDELAVNYSVGYNHFKAIVSNPKEGLNEVTITGLTAKTKYSYYVTATNSKGTTYSAQGVFKTLPSSTPTEMYAIDLDLPSGTLWASKNVGAVIPEHTGKLYGWGELVGYYRYAHDFNWKEHFKAIGGTGTSDNDINKDTDPLAGVMVLPDTRDAALAECGSGWNIPTRAQVTELLNNCNWTWTMQNGTNGYKVSSKTNSSKFIFLPVEEYRESYYINQASIGGFRDVLSLYSGTNYVSSSMRYEGTPIRPVAAADASVSKTARIGDASVSSVEYISATLSSLLIDDGGLTVECGFSYGTNSSSLTSSKKATPNDSGEFSVTLSNLKSNTTYYVRAYAKNAAGKVESEVVSFTTKSLTGQLNGHDWVDIGIRKSHLDSSIEPGSDNDRRIVFAVQNIGAAKSTDPGYFFRGGEKYGWKYSGSTNQSTYVTLNSSNLKQVYNDGSTKKVYDKGQYYPAWFNYDYDDDYSPDDYVKGYETGDAVNYYYGNGWQILSFDLANKLYCATAYNKGSLPSSATTTKTSLNGKTISLQYTFTSAGLTIYNTDLKTSVFLPRSGMLSNSDYTTDAWYPSGKYWTDGSPYYWSQRYFQITYDSYETDWDPDLEDYTSRSYRWMFNTSESYVWKAYPIRAIAELPL